MKDYILSKVVAILLLSLVAGCSNGIKNCDFKPGVNIEQKEKISEAERKSGKELSELESNLPVKVSPKGEVACTF
tara:strand:- start:210 stop:434 length:225 start_codon:yes stop_codon:yes gene_type:complete